MFEKLFNNIGVPLINPSELIRISRMVSDSTVSNLVGQSFNFDQVKLMPLQNVGAIPAVGGFNGPKSPTEQIMDMGKKYQIPYTGDIDSYQKRVVKAVIMHKALEYGVPMNVALGVAGNESGWKMWSNIQKGTLVNCKNPNSTDWGAMQINDHAHTKAFPRAKNDLEYNIDYGMQFLSNRQNKIKGSLGLGFGEWDRTIASYNLGHNPKSTRDYEIANKYVSRVKNQSLKV